MGGAPLLEALRAANEEYSRTFDRSKLPLSPAEKLPVLACVDARLDVYEILEL